MWDFVHRFYPSMWEKSWNDNQKRYSVDIRKLQWNFVGQSFFYIQDKNDTLWENYIKSYKVPCEEIIVLYNQVKDLVEVTDRQTDYTLDIWNLKWTDSN